jgi:hypothetical protein
MKIKRISNSSLIKKLDHVFREILKLRQVRKKHYKCFVCGKDMGGFFNPTIKKDALQVLHYVRRDVYVLRWDFRNCEMGCSVCNRVHNQNPLPHTVAIIKEYGQERIDELNEITKLSKQVGKSMTRIQKVEKLEELEQILKTELDNTSGSC